MKPFCRIAVLLPAVLILASGCATKGWVRETLDKKEAEIDQRVAVVGQRVDTVDGRVTQESERIQGVGSRVTTLETSVTEVSEAARGAKEASNAAVAKSHRDVAIGERGAGRNGSRHAINPLVELRHAVHVERNG